MTDTQTAFVLVPREPTEEMLEASVSPRDEFLTDAHVSVLKDGFAAKYRAMLSAAPKPPESDIGPVANYLLGDAHRRIEADRAIIAALRAEVESAEARVWKAATDMVAYIGANWPQDIKSEPERSALALLAAEIVSEFRTASPGDYLDEEWKGAEQAIAAERRAEAAEAEVAALKHDVESSGALRLRLNAYRDRAKVAEARVKELEAALANKETDK